MASDGSELLLEQEEKSADSSQDPLDSPSVAEMAGVSRRRTRSATRGPRDYKAKKTPKAVRDTAAEIQSKREQSMMENRDLEAPTLSQTIGGAEAAGMRKELEILKPEDRVAYLNKLAEQRVSKAETIKECISALTKLQTKSGPVGSGTLWSEIVIKMVAMSVEDPNNNMGENVNRTINVNLNPPSQVSVDVVVTHITTALSALNTAAYLSAKIDVGQTLIMETNMSSMAEHQKIMLDELREQKEEILKIHKALSLTGIQLDMLDTNMFFMISCQDLQDSFSLFAANKFFYAGHKWRTLATGLMWDKGDVINDAKMKENAIRLNASFVEWNSDAAIAVQRSWVDWRSLCWDKYAGGEGLPETWYDPITTDVTVMRASNWYRSLVRVLSAAVATNRKLAVYLRNSNPKTIVNVTRSHKCMGNGFTKTNWDGISKSKKSTDLNAYGLAWEEVRASEDFRGALIHQVDLDMYGAEFVADEADHMWTVGANLVEHKRRLTEIQNAHAASVGTPATAAKRAKAEGSTDPVQARVAEPEPVPDVDHKMADSPQVEKRARADVGGAADTGGGNGASGQGGQRGRSGSPGCQHSSGGASSSGAGRGNRGYRGGGCPFNRGGPKFNRGAFHQPPQGSDENGTWAWLPTPPTGGPYSGGSRGGRGGSPRGGYGGRGARQNAR